LQIRREEFAHVFGIDVLNPRYNPDGDPFFDDLNDNGVHDEGEPTAPFRPMLFEGNDWRSTDVRMYYRREDNGGSVVIENVDFEAETPRTREGIALVPRNYKPRLNAFRFGRPNTAINLLTAFAPPEFFNGQHGLNEQTRVDPFMAIALVNLVFDQVFNLEVIADLDGPGPLPRQAALVDGHLVVLPLGDPFFLLLNGLRARAGEQLPPLPPGEPGTPGEPDGGDQPDGSGGGDDPDGSGEDEPGDPDQPEDSP
jgi:hypothetical protein